jgi:putative oxidoreductase
MNYLVPLGRVFYSLIFLTAFSHFKQAAISHAAEMGVPLASIAVPLSGVIAILGGLSIALGYKAQWGAWLIVLFLVPVTLTMHAFWKVSDPQMAQVQQVMFFKNVSMLGAALMITQLGSGPISLKH